MEVKTMTIKINKILLSSEGKMESTKNEEDTHTDVLVILENEERYIASFFTYKNMHTIKSENQKEGDFLNGKYFWVRGMLLVESCQRKIVEEVIRDLIAEGDFLRIFRKINS